VIVLAFGIHNAPKNGSKEIVSPLLGKPAPTISLARLDDPSQKLAPDAFSGRWHLVNVWGTWCVECRAEHSMLLAIKAEGRIPIVGIDWKDEDADARSWLAQLGNPYETVVTDHDGRAAIDWGVYGAPESFLVDPNGIVVEKQIGAISADDWRQRFLSHLPAGGAGKGAS
jgi:cytochrome c biogenesis protein CcmG/thiol:disulfide interchange protein DsbE